MATRPFRQDHEAAVARRLEQLSAELAGVRGESSWDVAAGAEPAEPRPGGGPGQPVDASPVVPVPGRHAARRRTTAADSLVPEPLRGRVALGPAQVAVVAVLVAVGLTVTAWWVVRSDPAPVPVTPPVPTTGEALATPSDVASPESSTGGPDGPGGAVTVDVAGRVRRPGIAVLDAGARVVDALEAAGGVRPGVDLSGINLARLLVDGEQILVGAAASAPSAPGAPPPAPAAPAASGTPLVDLNTAGLAELETLPEVGPVTAQAIITWREAHGGFTAVDELLEVDGIGEATLEAMAPFVTV